MSRYIVRPDLGELAGLAFAQEFARAADLQIVRGEQESGAQILHRLDRLEPLGRIAAQRAPRGHDQVGVGAVVRAADAPAQLMELRQAEPVGAIDQDGVGGGHVDAAFDDGRAHQHVEAPMIEIDHQLLELALAHLPVAEAHLRLGHQRRELGARPSRCSAPRCAPGRSGRRGAVRATPHRAASARAIRTRRS